MLNFQLLLRYFKIESFCFWAFAASAWRCLSSSWQESKIREVRQNNIMSFKYFMCFSDCGNKFTNVRPICKLTAKIIRAKLAVCVKSQSFKKLLCPPVK